MLAEDEDDSVESVEEHTMDDDEEEEEEEEYVETIPAGEETNRLAIQNCDWDNMKALDVL